jgi:hypothetical protein
LVAALVLTAANTASAEWKEKVLYSFQGGSDGAVPAGGVAFDKAGNLYGATTYTPSCDDTFTCGTAFELSLQGGTWVETTLHAFQGHAQGDGGAPGGGVILDASGNVYGTTGYGGTGGCILLGTAVGCGTVYELSPPAQQGGQWTYAILYNFQGGNDGQFPWGDLVFDKKGNLYGATQFGGGKGTTCDPFYQYCGTVFELSPPKQKGGAWTEKVLHSFAGGTDGANPNGGLVMDSKGVIYGTTLTGGNQGCQDSYGVGCGTVFEVTPPGKRGGSWREKILHRFRGGAKDAAHPNGQLVFDGRGNLYGTSLGGAGSGDDGTVFEFSRRTGGGRWREAFPHVFQSCGGGDGCLPGPGLIFDSSGNLYGVTTGVFRMKPPVRKGGKWTLALLYKFTGSPDGQGPVGIIFGDAGVIYGTTFYGGTGQACQGGCGTAFEVWP